MQTSFSSPTWTISILTGLQLPFLRNPRSELPPGQSGGVNVSCLHPAQEYGWAGEDAPPAETVEQQMGQRPLHPPAHL